ncbi:hypothetical protein G3I52_13300 [Streptomyces cyaneofuscatus]|nr:hypothetical protein [Streptomyces cyaneofuscatus]
MVSERTSDPKGGPKSGPKGDSEEWKARGVFLRVFVYVFATHLFAGFVWILFYVGGHADK